MADKKKLEAFVYSDNERFINYYLTQEVLWNTRHPKYKLKDVRRGALAMIVQQMSEHGKSMSVEQVGSKIASLRTYYSRELRKVLAAQKSGAGYSDLYSSSWEFFGLLDPFLRPHVQPRQSVTNMMPGTYEGPSAILDDVEPGSSQMNHEYDNVEEMAEMDEMGDHTPVPPVSHVPVPSGKKGKCSADNMQSLIFDTLQTISQRKSQKENSKDTDILFGQQVGLEIKKIPNLRKRQELKIKIQEMIVAYQFDEL